MDDIAAPQSAGHPASDAAPLNQTPNNPPAGVRRAAFAFIFITVVLDMLALGVIIPVLPNLVLRMQGGNTANAAHWVGLFGTLWAFMQFVCMPVLGSLSDKVGRRPVVLTSNFGLGVDYLVMALAPNLWWLLAGRMVSGATSASVTSAYAYIADVTPIEQRAARFGMLGAAFGLGFVIGPSLGGYLGSIDPRLPFWVAASLSILNGCYGLFVLPESLPRERRSDFSWRKANPLGAFAFLKAQPKVLGLALVKFLNDLAHNVYPATFALYAMHRFSWGPREVGFALGGVGVASIVVQALLVGRIVKAIGERNALMLGLFCGSAAFIWYGLAPTWQLLVSGIPLAAMWGITAPAAQALMSRRVDGHAQGRLQGAVSSLSGVANMLGPTAYTMTFAFFISTAAPLPIPGAAFLLAGFFVLASIPLALVSARREVTGAEQPA